MIKYYSGQSIQSEVIRFLLTYGAFVLFLYFFYGSIEAISIKAWISWILFSGFILYYIVKAIRNKPTLLIDKEFIIDNSNSNACGKIAWDNILNIEIREGKYNRFLCFDLLDEEEVLKGKNFFKKMLMNSNKNKLNTICIIPELAVDDDLEDILHELKCIQKEK